MKLSQFLLFALFSFTLFSCGGGGGSSKTETPPTPAPPEEITISISGDTQTTENSRVTYKADTNATGTVSYTWEVYSNLDITPEISGDTLSFVAPKVFYNDFTVVDVALVVTIDGVPSETLGFSVVVYNEYTFEDNAEIVSTAALGAAESYSSMAYLVRSAINQYTQPAPSNNEYCGFNGTAVTELIDNDENNALSVGDTLHTEFSDCYISKVNATIYGAFDINITELSLENTTISGSVVLDNILIQQSFVDALTAEGTLDFTFSQTDASRTINISNDENIAFILNDIRFLDVASMELIKTENLLTAKYSISVQGEMSDAISGESYGVSTLEPFSGFFVEYPMAFNIQLEGDDGQLVNITHTDTNDFTLVNIELDGAELVGYWSNFIENNLFSFSTNNSTFLRTHISTNFELIGTSDDFLLLESPNTKVINYLAGRPVASFSEEPYIFSASSFPYEQVEARVELNGALLSIIVDNPENLRAGTTFTLNGVELYSELNQVIDLGFIGFTTSDAVIPQIRANLLGYREGQLPTLNAFRSILNEGDSFTYEWFEKSNVGITFNDANAEQTSFSLPANIQTPLDDIVVGLRLSNNLGDTALADTTIHYLPTPSSYFSINSDIYEYVGQGQQRMLNEANAISIQESQYQDNATSIRYETDDVNFELIIQAPNQAPLAVGEYIDATRLPFQDFDKPGMDFSGEARGCNMLTGSFTILELSYDANNDIDTLAVDFTQFCEGSANEKLTGQIRVNSSLAINQPSE